MISNAFRNIAALSLESGYKIPELSLLSTGSSEPAQNAPTETKAATKAPVKEDKPAKKEEPKEEEEDVGMGGLFD